MRLFTPSLFALTAALALSACSQEKSADDASAAASEAALPPVVAADSAAADQTGPGIGGAVAPGVAFTYSYAFTLPTEKISAVQQEHAAACARLGPKRCRVTGMRYEQPGEERVDARLDLLLAPDLAHRFGSDGLAAVERADGKLDHATINGEDAGGAIVLSQENSAAIQAEVERIEARLASKGLARQERADLSTRLAAMRDELRGAESTRRDQERALATTPVTFAYSSEGVLGGNTFGKAADASLGSLTSMLSFLLLIGGVALPWVALIALGVFGWRWLKRRPSAPTEPQTGQAPTL